MPTLQLSPFYPHVISFTRPSSRFTSNFFSHALFYGRRAEGLGTRLSIEDVVPQLSQLISQLPGKEACVAIGVALGVYAKTRQLLKEQGDEEV